LFFFLGESDPEGRIPIAVADFVNETNEPELNSLSGMLITSLEQSNRLSVATRARMFDILKQIGKSEVERIDESLGKEIAQQANIDALVTASIRKFGKLYTIDLKVLDTRTNEYLFTTKEEGEGQESIPGLIDALAEQTRSNLRLPVEGSEDSPRIANVTTTNMQAYAYYFRGEDLINQIKMAEAREQFRKAIEIDPDFALAHFRLGYALKWNEQLGAARNSLEKAMELVDRIPEREQYLLRSYLLDINGDAAGAVKHLKEAEIRFPQDKEIPYEIGDIEYHRGDVRVSIAYLQKTLGMDPTFERALEHLAWCYRRLGQYDKLKDVATRYVAVSDTSESYDLLFTAYLGLGLYDEAVDLLENTETGFSHAQIERRRGLVQLLNGDYENALQTGQDVLRSASTPREMRSAHAGLAQIYPYLGRFRDTYKAFDRAIALSWTIGDTSLAGYYHARKAVALWAAGRPIEDAREVFRTTKSFQNNIHFNPYWGFRAMMAAVAGDTSEVSFTSSMASGRLPGAVSWWFQAHIAMRENNVNRALALLDSIVSTGSFDVGVDADILYLKARALMDVASYDAAILTLNSIETVPSNAYGIRAYMLPRSYNLLGQAYEKKGDKAAAKASYEKLLAMWKNADPDLPLLIDTKKRLTALR